MNMEPDARKRQIMIWYVLAAVVGILLFQVVWASYSRVEAIPYSEFEALLDQGKVVDVTVGADFIQGTLKEPLPSGKREFFVVRVDPQLADKLASHQVVVNGTASGGVVQTILLGLFRPSSFMWSLDVPFFRGLAESTIWRAMTVGKSRARSS